MNKVFLPVTVILTSAFLLYGQRELVYDPDKGIVFDDPTLELAPQKPVKSESYVNKTVKKSKPIDSPVAKEDIHEGRKKDPPEIYFKSGIEYFKNSDFENALKNFSYADSLVHKPLYKLWKIKSLRRMGRTEQMVKLLNVIAKDYATSDVADDALLEYAVYYKSINDYENSLAVLTEIIEQYPFAVSSSTGEEIPPIAREQRKLIRAEMLNLLSIVGVKKEDLSAGIKQFQKENGLPMTGTGTPETISLLKSKHKLEIEKINKAENEKSQLEDYMVWTTIAAVLAIVLFFVFLYLRIQISSKKKQCIELQKALIELDLKKI